MLKRTLNKTNPYLADPAKRRAMFQMTVYTSTDIEGVKLTSSDLGAGIKVSRRITPRESAKSSVRNCGPIRLALLQSIPAAFDRIIYQSTTRAIENSWTRAGHAYRSPFNDNLAAATPHKVSSSPHS